MHHQSQLADLVDVLAVDFDIVDRLGDSRKRDGQDQARGFRREARGLFDRSMRAPTRAFRWMQLADGSEPRFTVNHIVVGTLRCAVSQGSMCISLNTADGTAECACYHEPSRCYRCVTLGCKPWRFLGWFIEPAWVRPKRIR
jgi:hypothetical protein